MLEKALLVEMLQLFYTMVSKRLYIPFHRAEGLACVAWYDIERGAVIMREIKDL